MRRDKYDSLILLARGWACCSIPAPVLIRDLKGLNLGVGIYCANRLDGTIDYVGSAARPDDKHGIVGRIRAHPARRRQRWASVWIVPLHGDTPSKIVRAIEGQIIDVLKPVSNRRRHIPCIVPFRQLKNTDSKIVQWEI